MSEEPRGDHCVHVFHSNLTNTVGGLAVLVKLKQNMKLTLVTV